MSAEFSFTGLERAARRLVLVVTTVPPNCGARLYRFGEIIITDAKQNYVPVRDGILRASGFVEQPKISQREITVRIGFGGAAEAYAAAQHERMDYKHTVGGPKYLERPVLAHANELKDEMRGVVGEGIGS